MRRLTGAALRKLAELAEAAAIGFAYRMHRADEYLASQRGDYLFAADCASRAEDCQRRLDTIAINRRFTK